MEDRSLLIAVAASFTADPVKPAIDCFLDRFGVAHRVALAPYGQLLRELLDPGGVFGQNRGGIDVALVRLADLDGCRARGHARRASDAAAMRRSARELAEHAAAHARREGAAPLLVCVCPEPRALLADAAYAALVAEIEAQLVDAIRAAGALVIPSAELLATYPVAAWDDSAADELGHIPYTGELFAVLGAVIARKVRAFTAAPHKVLALDADNTLWSGVAGEDGPDGVVIDAGREALQRFALAQREAGMLLCLCSKNTAEDVDEVFRRRAMPLRREHFVATRVSWSPKSESLRSIAAELGLGLDAFVLLDDSPVECAEVRAGCPEVLAVQLPASSAEAAALLRHVWAFDRWKITGEDRRRGALYQEGVERARAERDAPSVSEFLAGLELEVRIEAPQPADLARVAQLTFRTSQLNFTSVRRSEAEVQALLRGGETRCLKVEVRDRFGDHGLVGVMLFGARDGALVVDTFLLSCRVLQRGVEHRMLARLGEIARERGLARVEVPLVSSARNLPAQQLLRAVGEAWLAPREGGFVVRFPAEEAAALTYAPGAEAALAVEREGKEQPPPVTALAVQNAVIAAVARELTSAGALLARLSPGTAKRPRPALARAPVAPRTDAERAVAALCEEALGVGPVGVTDDLFLELGADSFTAVRIAAGMRGKLGLDTRVVTVQEAATVERLAAPRPAVTAGEAAQRPRRSPSIHALRREGARRPLFLARPATRSGGALSYAALARHVDADRPVYVFQNRPLLDAAEPYESIEQMAAEYLAAMREVQPRGPYLLAGWCLGGKTAFEMARQLAAAGDRAATLLLFDTPAPGGLADRVKLLAAYALKRAELRAFSRVPQLEGLLPWVKVARARSLMRRFGALAYYAHDDDDVALVEYAFPGIFEAAKLREMAPEARWDHVYAVLKAAEPEHSGGGGVDAASVRRGFKYFALDHRMDAAYAPRWAHPGDVELFTVRGGSALGAAWRPFLEQAPRVTEFALTGTKEAPDPHSAMMSEDNVRVMAGELNRVLSQAPS
jgi:FkbH-like protein